MTFAEKFKEERVKKELTQQQVADSLGITRNMITLYEKGTSLPRTRDAYKKIADFFGVDVNYLPSEPVPDITLSVVLLILQVSLTENRLVPNMVLRDLRMQRNKIL